MVYAIVKAGGRQHKVSEGTRFVMNSTREAAEAAQGEDFSPPTWEWTPTLVVDGPAVITDPQELSGFRVSAESAKQFKGKKIRILKFKNKTGYRKRMGHRQCQQVVTVTAIEKIASAERDRV